MILRWAGSKARQLNSIYKLLGCGDKQRLIEPFCGTAVVSLRSYCFDNYLLNDANPDLINFYKHLKGLEYPQPLDKEGFLLERDKFNNSSRRGKKAAQMFWNINRNCHRGLMNYDTNSRLITSFGANTVECKGLDEYHELFKRATLSCKDYKTVIRKSTKDDVLYIDPPYYDSTSRYNADYFGPDQHAELTLEIESAVNRGTRVLVSNYDLPFTRFLYRSADIIVNPPEGSMNLKKGNKELLALWE